MHNQQIQDDPYQDARIALLRYFNSQCMMHAGYFVSILVGLVITISAFERFFATPHTFVIFVGCLMVLTFGCVYSMVGVFYWGYLASHVIQISTTELLEEEKKKRTPMYLLHNVAYNRVCEYHPYIIKFRKLRDKFTNFLSKLRNWIGK